MSADTDAVAGLGSADPIVREAHKRFERCVEWESEFRTRFYKDIKFGHGDPENHWQWPDHIYNERDGAKRPSLTINVIRQHNLQIINESKRNKREPKVIPTGNGATVESALMLRSLMRHVETQSDAQSTYSHAQEFQVYGGIGYWRISTEWIADRFEQEIFIRPIKDMMSVYMDPDIKQRNGSDARFAFIHDDMTEDDFHEAYPGHDDVKSVTPLGFGGGDDWLGKDKIRVCEYFRKVRKKGKMVSFVDPSTGERKFTKQSALPKEVFDGIISDPTTRTRDHWEEEVEWYLIAGYKVIDKTTWPGKWIPIIRCVGEEIVVDGVLDRKGHTRAMKDAQRMLNYNASGQVEFVALQGKTPWTGAAATIEDHEDIWNTANTKNASFLPFNHLDDNGDPIPPQALPRRVDPPQAAPAFEAGMSTAFNQIMMASGQWQNQMGMMGNERTGEAIERRQDQGDNATFHFQDNYQNALVFTAQQLLDLFPKIYDTKRVLMIQGENGADLELLIDPSLRKSYLEERMHDGRVARRILNPTVGLYDVQPAEGPNTESKRKETIEAMTLILTQAPGLTGILGDLLMSAMDFDGAQEAAQRLRRMVPPQALGEGPSQSEQMLQQQNMQLKAAMQQLITKLGEASIKLKGKDQLRDIEAYKAETDRFKALADSLMLDQGGIARVIDQLVNDALQTSLKPVLEASAEKGGGELPDSGAEGGEKIQAPVEFPPMPGAQKAPDGEWYLADPTRRGRYLRIAPLAQERTPPGNVIQGG